MRRPGKSAASHDGAPRRHRDGGRSREIMAELSPPRSRTENVSRDLANVSPSPPPSDGHFRDHSRANKYESAVNLSSITIDVIWRGGIVI